MAFKLWKIAKVTGSPASLKNSDPHEAFNALTAAIAKKQAEKDIKKERKAKK